MQVLIKRANIVESIHNVKFLVKNSKFKTILSSNNDKDILYPRSSIKIFQAIPFVLSEADKKFGLSEKMLAIACASHCGENQHLKIVEKWIKKIKLSTNDLKCGIHAPINSNAYKNLLLQGNFPNQLHNNCSGKHLAMLSGCLASDLSYKNYINLKHPYQKLIRNVLEHYMGIKINTKNAGIDGCSAPQYAFNLSCLSKSMIKLIHHKTNKDEYSNAIKKLLYSIKNNPELIGGKNRFDSEIIKITKGRIFCKAGAEGVLLFADFKKEVGGIIKVADGNERAIPSSAMKIFSKLKLLNKKEIYNLNKWAIKNIYNCSGIKVGEVLSKIK